MNMKLKLTTLLTILFIMVCSTSGQMEWDHARLEAEQKRQVTRELVKISPELMQKDGKQKTDTEMILELMKQIQQLEKRVEALEKQLENKEQIRK